MYIIIFLSILLCILSFYKANKENNKSLRIVFYIFSFSFLLNAIGNYLNNALLYYLFVFVLFILTFLISKSDGIEKGTKRLFFISLIVLVLGYISSILSLPFKHLIFFLRYLIVLIVSILFLTSLKVKTQNEKFVSFFILAYFLLELYVKYLNDWF